MTSDKKNPIPTGMSAGALTFWGVMALTLAMARQQGWAFIRVLLPPVSRMALGLYAALVLGLLFVNGLTQPEYAQFTSEYLALVLAAVLAICAGSLFLFFQGTWQYFVAWVSLCRNVEEALEGRPLDFKAAYAMVSGPKKAIYLKWLALLCLLPAFPLIPIVALPALILLMPQAPAYTLPVLMLIGLLLGGLFGLGWLVVQILLTYGFQVIAFAEEPFSLSAVIGRSVALTRQRPWLTLALQAVLFGLTNYMLPLPTVFLLRFARVLAPLDDLHNWLAEIILGSWADMLHQAGVWAMAGTAMSALQENRLSIAQGVTDAVVSLNLSLLLLPLGTIAFTWVYLRLNRPVGHLAEIASGSIDSVEPQAD